MPLYFFHVLAGDRSNEDNRGEFYADTAAAQRHAALLAKRLAKDGCSGDRIVVTDGHGNHIAQVQIGEEGAK